MDIALLVCRLLLAAVFAFAAVGKATDREGTRRAVAGFGVPERFAQPVAALLPIAEVAVATALIVSPVAWWGALGALALLAAFTAGIVLNLARGRRPDCHCFGALHSEPIGASTIVRNVALAAVAGFLAARGPDGQGTNAFEWFNDLATAERVATLAAAGGFVLLAGLGALILNLMLQQGRLLLRLEAMEARLAGGAEQTAATAPTPTPTVGLPVGSAAPGFALPDLDGREHSLGSLLAAGRPALLAFVDSGCGPCVALLPDLGRWQGELASTATVIAISRGGAEANRPKATEHGLETVLIQADREVATAYDANATPSALLIRPDGTVGSPLAQGSEQIAALVAQVRAGTGGQAFAVPMAASTTDGRCPNCGKVHGTNGSAPQPAAAPAQTGPQVGQPAPSLKLPDLDGRTVDLADYRGKRTLVVFWNPGCGFCQQLLPDLKAWEASPPPGAPDLLVVSTGSVEANRALGLQSPVLLEETFTAGPRFGATGTPMALVVDEEGRIATPLAVGGPAVLALAGPVG